MNPFVTLGVPARFDLDLGEVEKRHRELSRALHPDRYVSAGASERRQALGKAVEVNEAFRVLRDPIRRAQALLELSGTVVPENGSDETDAAFLMEMLEQREALDEAKQAKDLQRVRLLARAIESRSKQAENALVDGFAKGEAESLKARLAELKFYRRFLDEVSAIEDELAA